MLADDTIVALSTAAGRSGVAVIRVSGPQTRFVLETISGQVGKPRMARLCALKKGFDQEVLDQALCLYFPGPASFTGEDIAEFHVHGSRAVIAAVLDVITSISDNIRLAQAGEFARRAFINGKMNLAEIEGLADLIDSETEWQRRQALRMVTGELGRLAQGWREKLILSLAYLDAEIDFMDEGDVGEGWTKTANVGVEDTAREILQVLKSSRSGERIRDGLEVVILGPPNSGKSSLLNAFSQRDVSIVTEFAGTTRDLIEVRCDLEGLPVTIVDTAGFRESDDPIEAEGIKRAVERARDADLIVSLKSVDSEAEWIENYNVETIKVLTKTDLKAAVVEGHMSISTLTGCGINELMAEICARLKLQIGEEVPLIARARQKESLSSALNHLQHIISGSASNTHPATELMAEDVRQAIRALERLIGRVDVDDVLDRIFGRFCIGK